MNNACCIGYGYVGKATALAFNIDKYYTRHESTITLEEAANCRYIFICLPTPTLEGKTYTDDIEQIIRTINSLPNPNGRVFIIRSTVPVGFAKSLGLSNIVSNPEFLSEDSWEKDAIKPWMIVVGADEPMYREIVVGLYRGRFKYSKPIETDNTTAEHIKYALNTFFFLKIIFGNEHFNFSQEVGSNYETIRTVLENSPWGSKNHFKIFYKGKRGVHGSCLPKDTESFATQTDSLLFKTLLELNKYE